MWCLVLKLAPLRRWGGRSFVVGPKQAYPENRTTITFQTSTPDSCLFSWKFPRGIYFQLQCLSIFIFCIWHPSVLPCSMNAGKCALSNYLPSQRQKCLGLQSLASVPELQLTCLENWIRGLDLFLIYGSGRCASPMLPWKANQYLLASPLENIGEDWTNISHLLRINFAIVFSLLHTKS